MRPVTPAAERFWARVDKTDDCWLWTGYLDPHGRGSFGLSTGVTVKPQRFAWELAYGPPPANTWVRHRCKEPQCVRPSHLMLGTAADFTAKRFWSKVNKTTTCWLWTGTLGDEGYGQFRVGRHERWVTHRFSYTLAHGPIPDGLVICHTCDVTRCVRPSHLFAATQADNIRDRDDKGHISRGEHRPHAKVTEANVRDMRARFAAGGVTQTALAAEVGLSVVTVNKIIHRKAWRHVG